jgi:hypothetical protein
VTDKSGTFNYKKGETVTFSLGGVVIGSVQGAQLITPVDLVPGATDENNETVTNISRLLQSLDLDGNPDNGISIPANIKLAMENISLDFSAQGFGNSPALSDLFRKLNDANLFPQKRSLVSPEIARTHLKLSLHNGIDPQIQTPNRVVQTITDTPAYNVYNGGLTMAFDSKDVPHLIIGGDHVYHYFRQTDGWHTEIIDVPGMSGGYIYSAKLFIDSKDYLHVIFRDSSSQLKYATNRPGYWSVEALNAAVAVVDSSGNLHMVSYDATGNKFTYGTNASGRWATESFQTGASLGFGDVLLNPIPPTVAGLTIQSALGVGLGAVNSLDTTVPSIYSLAVDAMGKAHLVFCRTITQGVEDTTLQYASNSTGTWQIDLLYEGYSISPSAVDLVVDQKGVPHVAYGYNEVIHGTKWCMGACDNMDQVDYFTKVNGQWVMAMADGRDNPDYVSLNVAKQGAVHLAISNIGYLSYLTNTGTAWVRKNMAAELGNVTAFSSALDSSGNLHMGHLDQNGLRYATFANEVWQVENISMPKPSGEFPDLATDAAGKLHISFWDAAHQSLNYATNSHGIWTSEVVSTNVTINKPTTISTDSQGNIHICYIDPTSNKIMYAKKAAGNWSIQAVGINPYGRPSMAVDGAGNAHIVYFDWINWGLMYANNTSGSWTVSQVVNVDWRVNNADISVTSDGKVYVCLEVRNLTSSVLTEGLWLISKNSGAATWNFEKAYSGRIDNSYCTIVADETGEVHLAYRIAGQYGWDDQLMYSRRKSTGWVNQSVAKGQNWKLSIALDSNHNPFISYYDAANGAVNYTYNLGSGWLTRQLVQLITYDKPDFLAPISVDSAGHLNAVYFDQSVGDLKAVTISDPSSGGI